MWEISNIILGSGLRIGQFFSNFERWLKYKYRLDIYYVKGEDIVKLVKEFNDYIKKEKISME